MKFSIPRSYLDYTPYNLLVSAGYKYIVSRHTNTGSFIRPVGHQPYPRFHIYLDDDGVSENVTIKLHLDQKRAIYQGVTAHSGEYEGDVVAEELNRLKIVMHRKGGGTTFGRPNPRLQDSGAASEDPRSQRWSDMLRRM